MRKLVPKLEAELPPHNSRLKECRSRNMIHFCITLRDKEMAHIIEKGKTANKRFQFYSPSSVIDEYTEKKKLLEKRGKTIDLTEDFTKVLKSAIKSIDEELSKPEKSNSYPGQNNQNV